MKVTQIANLALPVTAALSITLMSPGIAVAQEDADPVFHRAYISTEPSPVRLAGEEVFSIRADAGGFTAEERSIIIERNLNNALFAARDRSPESVEIVTINGLPVIRLGGKHIVTVDSNLAKIHGTSCEELAFRWASGMRRALIDTAKVDAYVAQLDGDFLSNPYSPPYRRARLEAARLNHAANEFRKDVPANLVSSGSLSDDGFQKLMARDLVAAEVLFREALTKDESNERAYYGLGLSLLKQGHVEDALKSLEMARWLNPDDAQVHIALGEALETKGQDRLAIERYKEASLLQPENPEPSLFIADIREERNDIGKSVAELTEASKACPESDYLRLRRKDQISWRYTKPY